jgi:hypothetical protein
MTNIWNWVVSGSAGFVGGLLGGTFKWFFPSRRDWNENRKAKADQKVDSKVLGAIGDYKLWTGARPMTGAGIPVIQAQEIAEVLNLDLDTVADSLERLRFHGRVSKDDDCVPPNWWHRPQ